MIKGGYGMDSIVARKIEGFFAKYPLRRFKKGQILVYAGDDPPGVFHLVSGQVRQYDITESGDEVVVNVFKPPAYFPMSWVINKTPNQYFYETATPVTLRQAPAPEALKFLKDNHDVMFDLLSRVYSGSDGLLRRMAHLMGGTARSRTIFELINECRRFGKDQDGIYVIEINESELAARAGLSRETVSRELHKLKEKGLVDTSRNSISIKNLKRLEKELGSSL